MWLIIIALAIGLVFASLLYFFSRKYSKSLTGVLFFLRTIVVATVIMLFINPYIRHKTDKIERPIVIFAQDNSESVTMTKDSVFYKTKFPILIDSVKNIIGKDSDVETVLFGGQYTNINDVLQTIKRQYYKQNVGAVILISDGIVNQGVNPELSIENYPFPIYSVTLGDTVSHPSISIKDVKYNKTVQANMLFPLRVTVNALSLKGEEADIVVKMDGTEVEKILMPITSNRFSKTLDLNIDSGDEGTKQIEIIVERYGRTSQPNRTSQLQRVFINVTDRKYRIICIAKAPHPDIAAIKSTLDDHFEFTTIYDNCSSCDVDEYDLAILHQTDIRAINDSPINIPTLEIVGSDTDFDAFNELQDIVKINRGTANTNLDIHGRFNNSFGLFTVNSEIKNEITSFPPLALPHCEISFNSHHDDAIFMNIINIETPTPVLTFITNEKTKHAYFFGTGCWHWKLYEYFHHKNNDGFNEIFGKTIKYLLTEKDKELTINHKENYLNTENINISAELRNPSGELTNEPDLPITIQSKDVSGNVSTYDYVFSKGENNYNLNIGMLPVGIYSYHAHTSSGGIDYNADGIFTVESVGVEAQDLTANIDRMRSLAYQTGGKHHYITDIQQLVRELQDDERIASISRQETRYDDLINLKWLFFCILTLITTEWLLRKIFGIY